MGAGVGAETLSRARLGAWPRALWSRVHTLAPSSPASSPGDLLKSAPLLGKGGLAKALPSHMRGWGGQRLGAVTTRVPRHRVLSILGASPLAPPTLGTLSLGAVLGVQMLLPHGSSARRTQEPLPRVNSQLVTELWAPASAPTPLAFWRLLGLGSRITFICTISVFSLSSGLRPEAPEGLGAAETQPHWGFLIREVFSA